MAERFTYAGSHTTSRNYVKSIAEINRVNSPVLYVWNSFGNATSYLRENDTLITRRIIVIIDSEAYKQTTHCEEPSINCVLRLAIFRLR